MVLFEEDLNGRNRIEARYLRARARAGMGRAQEAEQILDELLELDLNQVGAADLQRYIGMPDIGASEMNVPDAIDSQA